MVKERGVVGRHQGSGGVTCNYKILIDNRYSDNFLLRKCNTIVVSEINPESSMFNPEGSIAEAFDEWESTGNLTVLREAYRKREREINGWGSFLPRTIRKTRQVVAGILSMLGGAVLGNEWSEIKSLLGIGGGAASSTAVTQVVNKNTAYERRLNTHLISMEGTAKVLVSQVDDLESFKKLENEYDKIVALRQQVFAIYDRLQLGVSQLIQNQRVNTNLVSAKTMYQQLTLLSTKLRMDHKDLLLTDRSQVWEMDTSYVLFANFTIVLFVHFPVGSTKTKLKLVEYIPTPLKLGNDPQVYTLHSEKIYLAVSTSRHSDFQN